MVILGRLVATENNIDSPVEKSMQEAHYLEKMRSYTFHQSKRTVPKHPENLSVDSIISSVVPVCCRQWSFHREKQESVAVDVDQYDLSTLFRAMEW